LNDRVLLHGKEEIMRLRIPLLSLLTINKEARSLALKNGMEWGEVCAETVTGELKKDLFDFVK
jgi:hypothetical protein